MFEVERTGFFLSTVSKPDQGNIYMYKYIITLLVCLSVCLFVSNKMSKRLNQVKKYVKTVKADSNLFGF